jgi:UDP-2,3-diacylglucosamine hydrolase
VVSVAGPGLVPNLNEWHAPEHWRAIDFISDLHLADNTPRTFEAFAAHLRGTDADAVVILGDLFEVWVGDDARHFGFEAACAQVLAEASARRVLAFMAGNRDFLVGSEMLAACGVRHLADPTVLSAFGQRMVLTHGDALCLSDHNYQRFRAQVRSDQWQREFLAQPLEERRRIAREIRDESQHRKSRQKAGEWIDVDKPAAVDWMRAAAAPEMIHGHTHVPGDEPLAPGFVRHVLSDWDLDHPGAAARAEVLRWQASGLSRIAPSVG